MEAEEFSLRTGPRNRVTAGAGSDGGGNFLPSRTGPGSIVVRCDAAVSTAAEAVAEVHSSAVDDEGDPSVVCTSRQRSAVILDAMAAPRKDGGPMEDISVLEPLEHSVLEVSLEGGDSLIVEVALSDPLEHSGVDRAADVVSGWLLPEPLEHSVLVVPQEVGDGSVADITVLDPLDHSGVGVRYPHIFRGCTRKIPGMEEVVRGTIGVKIIHSRTPSRRLNGPNRRMGRPLS